MAQLYYPLEAMRLRNDAGLKNNPVGATFGKVRTSTAGEPANHQGWDLYAPVGTKAYAVGDGVVAWVQDSGAYGLQLLLQFSRLEATASGVRPTEARSIFAFYAHLGKTYVKEWDIIKGGQAVALTGISGHGSHAPNKKYPHLHFEVRTDASRNLGTGLQGRVDPSEVLGGHLLSCGTEQIGGTDVSNMVSIERNAATPIQRTF